MHLGANGHSYNEGVRVSPAANIGRGDLFTPHENHHDLPAMETDHRLAEIPQTGQPGYHGPTSTLYDEFTEQPCSPSPSDPSAGRHDDLLVAEAAKQRMLHLKDLCIKPCF